MAKHKITFKFPKKTEIFLIVLAIFALFLLDVNQNKANDLGKLYEVHLIASITIKALTLFWIGFIVYYALLLTLIVRSVIFGRTTSYKYDFIIGGIALFGTAIILLGAITAIFLQPGDKIPFFNLFLEQITLYHIFGILPQVLALFYFALTE